MKIFLRILALTASTIFFHGCAGIFYAKPKITKRYNEIIGYDNTTLPNNYVKVTGFVTKPVSSTSKTIFDLSERGQKALIETIGKLEKSPSKIAPLISAPIKLNTPKKLITNHTLIKKRIVLSVEDIANLQGADRLQSIRIRLKRPSGNTNYKLVSWDKIVTQYQDIDVGKLSFSQTDSSNLSAEIALTGTIQGGLSGSSSNTDILAEELQLTKRFPRLTGSITEDEMVIHRQSTALESMDGNVILEVTFKLSEDTEKPVYSFKGLFDKGKAVMDESKITIDRAFHILPSIDDPDKTLIEMAYDIQYRKVIKGHETYTESDDKIKIIYNGVGFVPFVKLCDEDDLNLNLWVLKKGDKPVDIVQGAQKETLRFSSFKQAQEFLKWLKMTGKLQFSGYQLTNPDGLDASDLKNLVISLN